MAADLSADSEVIRGKAAHELVCDVACRVYRGAVWRLHRSGQGAGVTATCTEGARGGRDCAEAAQNGFVRVIVEFAGPVPADQLRPDPQVLGPSGLKSRHGRTRSSRRISGAPRIQAKVRDFPVASCGSEITPTFAVNVSPCGIGRYWPADSAVVRHLLRSSRICLAPAERAADRNDSRLCRKRHGGASSRRRPRYRRADESRIPERECPGPAGLLLERRQHWRIAVSDGHRCKSANGAADTSIRGLRDRVNKPLQPRHPRGWNCSREQYES